MVDMMEQDNPEEVDEGMDTSAAESIKVLIVDDHEGVRAGLRSILHRAGNISVVGEAGNGEEAVSFLRVFLPDIVLLDIEMPGLRGDYVMRWIHESHPEIKVLAVSSHMDGEYVRNMLEGGASGYISKDEAPDILLQAIHAIIEEGVSWYSPTLLNNGTSRRIEDQTLTEREVRILQQLLLGRRPDEIATLMEMEPAQLGRYLDLMMRKFKADSLDELQEIARRILPGRTTRDDLRGY